MTQLIETFLRKRCERMRAELPPTPALAPSLEAMQAIALYRAAKADPARKQRFRAMEAARRAEIKRCEKRLAAMSQHGKQLHV